MPGTLRFGEDGIGRRVLAGEGHMEAIRVPHDRQLGKAAHQCAKPRVVADLHAFRVDGDLRRAVRSEAALGQGVDGPGTVRRQTVGGDAQTVRVAVHQVEVGLVVPLPQDAPAVLQLIAGIQRRVLVIVPGGGQRQCLGDLVHHGPAVHPAEGHRHRDAPHRAVVLEEHHGPGSIVELHRPALGHTGLAAIQVQLHELAALEVAVQRPRPEAAHGPHVVGPPVDAEQVVPPVVADEVAALPAQAGIVVHQDDAVQAVRLLRGQIRRQLGDAHRAVAVGDIDAPLVKEQTGVIPEAAHLLADPRVFRRVRRIMVAMPGVVAGKHRVECPPVVLEGRGPHALAVDMPAVHALTGGLAKGLVDIGAVLPAHQIIAAQNLRPGEHVHGGGDHVVRIADAHHVGVGEVGMDDGVGKHGRHLRGTVYLRLS